MNIQYINKEPSKMEIYEIMDSIQNEIDEDMAINIFEPSDEIITTICAYHFDKIVGMGRVIKEDNTLYIQDIIIKPEYKGEEIENNIIVNLFRQINELRRFNPSIQRCLQIEETEENFFNRFSFLTKEKQELGA
ncbi:MAG: hypothetical protein J6D03_01880 [Clostridia bacterium]|nr:hypothetical protein [Clostridia bacterium]